MRDKPSKKFAPFGRDFCENVLGLVENGTFSLLLERRRRKNSKFTFTNHCFLISLIDLVRWSYRVETVSWISFPDLKNLRVTEIRVTKSFFEKIRVTSRMSRVKYAWQRYYANGAGLKCCDADCVRSLAVVLQLFCFVSSFPDWLRKETLYLRRFHDDVFETKLGKVRSSLSRTVWQPNNTSSWEFRTSRLHCFPKQTENEFWGWWEVVSSTTVFVEFSTRAGQLWELLSGSQNSKLLKFCSPMPLQLEFWSGSRRFQVLRVFSKKSSRFN